MKSQLITLAAIALIATTITLSAQPGPPGGGNNGWGNGGGNDQGGGNGNGNFGGGNNGNGNGNGGNNSVPLDGGVTLLLGAGGAVAYRQARKRKMENQ